jgi:hypothetical protein
MRAINGVPWQTYQSLLTSKPHSGDLPLPVRLCYHGALACDAHPVPPRWLLDAIAAWLHTRGQEEFYVFLTEVDETLSQRDFLASVADLTTPSFSVLPGYFYAKVLAGIDFSWAIFLDPDGGVHVAGEESLAKAIVQARTQHGGSEDRHS